MRTTRRRIVEAGVSLHTTVGPARTSISAVAERAGVQRHTVYAHFPSERELFRACAEHWTKAHPFPEPAGWAATADPSERLRGALEALYRWYELVEHDLALFVRDIEAIPEQAAESDADLRALRDLLTADRPRRRAVRGAIGHALEFETWRSLVRRQGFSRRSAVDAMVRLVESV
jgi:AcrR family transcriptional regulator